MPFELTILGCGSATPTPERYPSAQFLVFADHHILIDCGEGAQVQMMRYGVKMFRLNLVFISHLHPDHFLGLPGLISSLSLKGRKEPMDIYCPKGLKEILDVQFLFGEVHLSYELRFHVFNDSKESIELDDKYLTVFSFALNHRLACRGFVFREKKASRKIKKELPDASKLSPEAYPVLRSGKDYMDNEGKTWLYEEYTIPNDLPFAYAYISDTLYMPKLASRFAELEINTLYHEATFMDELKEKAITTCHSTAKEAAEFAVVSSAKRLLIGHFSSRYKDLEPLLNEAKAIFPNSFLAVDGAKFVE